MLAREVTAVTIRVKMVLKEGGKVQRSLTVLGSDILSGLALSKDTNLTHLWKVSRIVAKE